MDTKKLLIFILLILGIITIIILGSVLFFIDDNDEKLNINDQSGLIISNNAIYVADQIPGDNILVQVAHLEKPGFVVIHEDNNGAPGKILGVSSLLGAGETKNLPSINLFRATKDNETIYAMIHLDNGDGKFDVTNDKPALDSIGGVPVMMIVTISKDATEPKATNP